MCKKQIYFSNYDVTGAYDEAKKFLLEQVEDGILEKDDITETRIWDEVNYQEDAEFDCAIDCIDSDCNIGNDYYIIMQGYNGTWMGRMDCGFIFGDLSHGCDGRERASVDSFKELFQGCCSQCDYYEFGTNENGNLFIRCSHHDGTNYYEFRRMTDAGVAQYDRWGDGVGKDANLGLQEEHQKLFDSNYYSVAINNKKQTKKVA